MQSSIVRVMGLRDPSDRFSSPLAEDHEPWVTKAQLAEHLKVHEKTVERLVASGMPCLRPGRRAIRFCISECEAWLGARS